jgi:hypothetical protein
MDKEEVSYAQKFYDIVSGAEEERADLNGREDLTSSCEEKSRVPSPQVCCFISLFSLNVE